MWIKSVVRKRKLDTYFICFCFTMLLEFEESITALNLHWLWTKERSY